MHLFKKWSKYAFAYTSMQMHNYPKPSNNLENALQYSKSMHKR